MEFRLLGPIELWAGGKQQDLGSAKERCILAVLLLARGRPVPIDAIIDRVWGEQPPSGVVQSLHADVSRLRKKLRAVGAGDEPCLRSTSHTYALDLDPEAVDLCRFRRLRTQAAAILDSGDGKEAATLLRGAESLWRSEPLAGLSGDWVERTRASLDSEYRAMALELVDVELTLGRHADIVGYLHDLIDRYPFDETLVGKLMIAYYRCGRQADALDLYARTMQLLAAETGVDAGPDLQKLQQCILRHDPALAFSPHSHGHHPVPNTLPDTVAEFTGRAAEVAALTTPSGRANGVIVIEGMPGVGKTALAIRIAHDVASRYPDALLYLSLHAHDPERPPAEPAAALSSLLRMLGVNPGRIPQGSAERAKLWRGELTGRRALIVLDDASGSKQVLPLLPRNPECLVIVTSRRSIDGLAGAGRHPLRVLPVDEAVALFKRIAGPLASPASDELADAAWLCGCLPLAIRLAATCLRDGQVPSISELVDQLRDAREEVPDARERDTVAAFELSYRDLTVRQQRAFRYLGLHPGPEVGAAAASALADISIPEAERALAELAEHYLLERVSDERYRFHDLIRQYALSCAIREDAEPERRRAAGRMLDHYLLAADHADRILYPHRGRKNVDTSYLPAEVPVFASEQDAQAWMESEWRNLLCVAHYSAAHEWHTHVIGLSHAVAKFFDATGRWEEAEVIHRRTLKTARDLDLSEDVAQASLNLAFIQWRTGRFSDALASAHQARSIYRDLSEPGKEAAALDIVGLTLWSSAQYRPAHAYFGEALDLYREVGNIHGEADCLGHIGMTLWHTGRYDESLRSFQEALNIYTVIGDRRGLANSLNNIADVRLHLGYHRDAASMYEESRKIYQTISGRCNNAILLANLASVDQYKGNLRSALRAYRLALSEFTETGDRVNQSDVLNNIGTTFCRAEKFDEAIIHHQQAISVADEIDNVYERTRALLGIGDADAGLGRYTSSLTGYRTCLRLARDIGDRYLEARALGGLAVATLHTEGKNAARIYWRQSHDLLIELGLRSEADSVQIRLQDLDRIA